MDIKSLAPDSDLESTKAGIQTQPFQYSKELSCYNKHEFTFPHK